MTDNERPASSDLRQIRAQVAGTRVAVCLVLVLLVVAIAYLAAAVARLDRFSTGRLGRLMAR